MKVALAVLALIATVYGAGGGVIDYAKQAEWSGDCVKTDSKKQSPIDVITPTTSKTLTDAFAMPTGAKTAAMTYSHINNTIKYTVGGNLQFAVPMFNRTTTLNSLHFHWSNSDSTGSEHALDGTRYAACCHLVTTYTSGSTTKYAVVNRFFKKGAENAAVGKLLEEANLASFDLTALYPNSIDEILMYEGSLTTPGCDEKVQWLVVPEILEMSEAQLTKMRAYTNQESVGTKSAINTNVRDLQALNGRVITKYASSGTNVMYSMVLIVAAIAKMLF